MARYTRKTIKPVSKKTDSEMRPEFTMTVDLPHPLIVVDG